MKSQSNAILIITSCGEQGDGLFIGAETPSPHNSPSPMPSATPAASNNPESAWSAQDAVLVGASFAISLLLGAFAAQMVMDSPFVSSASKQPIVVSLR